MELTKLPCRHCGAGNNRSAVVCVACGESVGPVNVNLLSDPYFHDGLEQRFQSVMNEVAGSGKAAAVQAFEQEVTFRSRAVINLDAGFLFRVVNDSEDYLPYQRAVETGKRAVKAFEEDLRRCVVETAFYGYTGRNLVYAALSLDDNGLRSYGDASVVLATGQIERRTTVFEKETYPLYDELTGQGWRAGTIMPAGYGSIWGKRGVVAVVKYGLQVAHSKKALKNETLLLHSDGEKQNDEFIELHIFNKITTVNFAKVTFHKKPGTEFNNIQLLLFKQILENQGTEIAGL